MKPSDLLSVVQLSIPWDFAVVARQKHQTTIQKSAPFVADSRCHFRPRPALDKKVPCLTRASVSIVKGLVAMRIKKIERVCGNCVYYSTKFCLYIHQGEEINL